MVILMKVHLPVHLPRHSIALWISGGRDRRCLFSSARQCLLVVRNKKLIGIRELVFSFFPRAIGIYQTQPFPRQSDMYIKAFRKDGGLASNAGDAFNPGRRRR